MAHWNTPLREFPGIGEARAEKLHKLGLRTAGDLVTYFPRTYEDRTQVFELARAPQGVPVCVTALVKEPPRTARIRKGLEVTRLQAVDGGTTMTVTFFNQSYLRSALHVGEEYIFYGVVERRGNFCAMTNPVVEPPSRREMTGRILPVYPLTAGITNRLMMSLAARAVEDCVPTAEETLPGELLERYGLAGRQEALRGIHIPGSFPELGRAQRRLAFEELFTLALGLALLRRRKDGLSAPRCGGEAEEFFRLLPFAPTAAQRRVVEELRADLRSGRPMNRLVQGDVGSGKTAVAAACAYLVCKSGFQAALMAPTEILAEQHYRSLAPLLQQGGITVGLLTGSLKLSEKKRLHQALRDGEIDFVIGTHALLSEGVSFARLGLIVTDEQHRFGVEQRSALAAKAGGTEAPDGEAPHVLVMSATPIPRTLALIFYGDLDVSVLDELPPGRTPVETYLIGEDKRRRLYNFVRRLAREGRQIYMVCPAVEEGEEPDGDAPVPTLKAVKQYARELQEKIFPDLSVAFLHGKMKGKEKDAVMSAFAAGETQVLVSTTVIEVGVDVPNAALMVIENAERFGLSQLHQLRGRVGRGKHQSYCVLISSAKKEETVQRLKALCATTDGFRIAEEDLKLRGPGDFFGQRQHGLPELKAASLTGDVRLLREAQLAAEELLAEDPELTDPAHAPLRRRVSDLFEETAGKLN